MRAAVSTLCIAVLLSAIHPGVYGKKKENADLKVLESSSLLRDLVEEEYSALQGSNKPAPQPQRVDIQQKSSSFSARNSSLPRRGGKANPPRFASIRTADSIDDKVLTLDESHDQFVSFQNMTQSQAKHEAQMTLATEAGQDFGDKKSLCGDKGCFHRHNQHKSSSSSSSEEQEKEAHKSGSHSSSSHSQFTRRSKRKNKKRQNTQRNEHNSKEEREDGGVRWRLRLHKSADGENYYVLTNEYSSSNENYDNGDLIENGTHNLLLYIGLGCVFFILMCFLYQLTMHTKYLRWMQLQKCYLRIIMLASVYSIFAWLSIFRAQYAGYFEIFRSIYEGYVLIVFAKMIIIVAGGWQMALEHMKQSDRPPTFLICPCECTKIWTFKSEEFALRFYMGLVYQFFVIKPIVAIMNKVFEEEHEVIQHDKYLKTIVIISVTMALIGIVNLYHQLNERNPHLNLGLKIGVLKGAVFFTVWQEVIFHILISEGVIESVYCRATCHGGEPNCPEVCNPDVPRSGVRTVAMLVVVEMLILAILNLWVFSHKDKILTQIDEERSEANEKQFRSSEDPTKTSLFLRICQMLVSVLFLPDFSGEGHDDYLPYNEVAAEPKTTGDDDNNQDEPGDGNIGEEGGGAEEADRGTNTIETSAVSTADTNNDD